MPNFRVSETSRLNRPGWRWLAWAGIVLQASGMSIVWYLERWDSAWIMALFFIASLAFMLLRDRVPSFLTFLLVAAAVLNAAGWTWTWYDKVFWFDELVHFSTGVTGMAALGYVLWTSGFIRGHPGTPSFIARVALVGLGLGLAWEIVEAMFVSLTAWDTVGDLLVDTIGSSLGGLLAARAIEETGAEQPA